MLSKKDVVALSWYTVCAVSLLCCLFIIHNYFISPKAHQKSQVNAEIKQQHVTIEVSEIEKKHKEKAEENITPTPNQTSNIKAAPSSLPGKKSYINIIITDLGLSPLSSQYALQMPKEVTMGFSPHSHNLNEWIEKADQSNHHILLTLPVSSEPLSLNSTAPYTLSTTLDTERNIEQLKRILARTKKKLGIYAPNTPLLSSNATLAPVLETIKKENLVWVQNQQTLSENSTKALPSSLGVTNFSPEGIIDQSLAPQNIRQALKELEKRAKINGYAIAVARPYPVTLRTLEEWFSTLDQKGITLTSLPALHERMKNDQ